MKNSCRKRTDKGVSLPIAQQSLWILGKEVRPYAFFVWSSDAFLILYLSMKNVHETNRIRTAESRVPKKKKPTYRCLCDALSGYYVYTEVSNRTGFYADAHLISPFFRQAGKTCKFKFWYHMLGPNIGYLQIYYRRNSRDKRLLSIFGNKGNRWIQGQVDVPKCADDFQVGKFFFLIRC